MKLDLSRFALALAVPRLFEELSQSTHVFSFFKEQAHRLFEGFSELSLRKPRRREETSSSNACATYVRRLLNRLVRELNLHGS